MPKVLYVCHNHPSVRPGGVETYALELYEAMQAAQEFEPILLAKGPPLSRRCPEHGAFGSVNEDPNQYFLGTDDAEYDHFYGTSLDKVNCTKHFHEFLSAYQPDIVHFQHTLFLGYDFLRQTRNTLAAAPIVYTLHEYLPICHNKGQMVRTDNKEPCGESSPRRCHECFPDLSAQAFFMRKRFIQSHFEIVDLFLAPSRFLLERYVEWGIPRDKILYEEYGRRTPRNLESQVERSPEEERPRNRVGFFGQFNSFKGVTVLLEAMKILDEERKAETRSSSKPVKGLPTITTEGRPDSHDVVARLWLHGANLASRPKGFRQEFNALVEATRSNVTLVGRYDQDELPRLMANVDWVVVPSIWWENSPLVIQEAFFFGRPVICSDIGGMAEKVTDGVNGLHFRAGNPFSLAETIRRAVSSPRLWESLRSGIPAVHKIEDHVATLTHMYRALLDGAPSRR